MIHVTVSLILVYAGFYVLIVFLSLSIACGMYYLAELVEEYTQTAKKAITASIKVELVLHLLLVWDFHREGLALAALVGGVAAHLAYLRLMRQFPYIELSSARGLISIGLFIVSNVLWIRFYLTTYYTVEYILAFLLVIAWIVPFALFISLAANDAVLPGAGGRPYSAQGNQSPDGQQRRGLLLKIFDFLRRKRDIALPHVAAALPASAGLSKDSRWQA